MRTEEEFRSRTWRILRGEEIRLHQFLFEDGEIFGFSEIMENQQFQDFG